MCSPGHTVATEDGLLAPTWSWAGPTLGLVQGVPRDPPCAAGGGVSTSCPPAPGYGKKQAPVCINKLRA